MPQLDPWVWWLAVYWLGVWAIFLEWYSRQVKAGRRPKMHWLVAAFSLLFIGALIPALIVISILKGVAKTKR